MSTLKKINTTQAPAAIGPYSQAIHANNMLFVSGQIPIDPSVNAVVDGIEAQTHQVFKNIKAILDEAGFGIDQVVRVEVFMKDLSNFQIMNNIYESFFTAPIKPARQAVEVSRLPKDVLIEISCIAVQ